MIRGAIFDVDGTLLDSMGIWDTIGNDYLLSLGIETEENLAETFSTFSLEESARYYQDNYNVELSVDEIIAGVNHLIESFYLEKAELKSGVREFLELLRREGVRMTIATATDINLIEGALSRCGVREYFSEILTCSMVGRSKRYPDIYRRALENLGTEKGDTFVFEDAYHAARTANDDGFPVVGVFDPSESSQTELREMADIYIESFAELTSLERFK